MKTIPVNLVVDTDKFNWLSDEEIVIFISKNLSLMIPHTKIEPVNKQRCKIRCYEHKNSQACADVMGRCMICDNYIE